MKKTLLVITAMAMLMVAATGVHAASYKFVVENSGNSYLLGSGNYLGLLGVRVSDVPSVDLDTLTDSITSGSFLNIYAGPDYDPGTPEWTMLSLTDLLNFDGSGNARNSLWFEYSNTLVFSHLGYAGTATMGNNGNLGYLQQVPNPTPIPGAVWLLGSGLMGLVGYKNRRKLRRS